MCLEPIITAQHSDGLCGLDKCRGQKNQHVYLELDLEEVIDILHHLVGNAGQDLHVEAHIKLSLKPFQLQDLKSLFDIIYYSVVNC